MAKNLFITATEARSGKSAIALGIMELLIRNVGRVGFFRPLIHGTPDGKTIDDDICLFSSYFKLGIPHETMFAYTLAEAADLLGRGRQDELLEGIFNAYKEIEKDHDFVLCEGIELEGSGASLDFDVNAQITKNLGCPVLLVANARRKSVENVVQSVKVYHTSFLHEGCEVLATIVNRAPTEDDGQKIISRLEKESPASGSLFYAVPEDKRLGNPTMGEIAKLLGAEILYGEDKLNRHVYGFTVAAMQLRNFLKRIEYGMLVITPGDRSDVIVACLSAVSSMSMPNIAGILLTGGLKPEESVCRLIDGFPNIVPILSVAGDTFPSTILVSKVHAGIAPDNLRKINRVLEVFDQYIDSNELSERIIETRTTAVTPKMFEYGLLQKARAKKQHIVLPEGEDERILCAAEILLRREVVDLTLLGNEERIKKQILRLGLKMDSARIMEVRTSEYFEDYVQTYYELRKHKGMTLEAAKDFMSDVNFFGTMMVRKGHADGMVSGAVHTTQATIRPAFEIIKTKAGFSVVSSVFFMCLKDRVLVYGDCAINPDPDAAQLAEIAVASAQTARIFDIEPRIAMLSYSTGESGKGEEVEKVRQATQLARDMSRERGLDLKLEGPIQYDAAIDPGVAKIKMPDSEVAGKATVFIFPDLNTGNNTYKAVQRSAGAVAVGPILQGLKRPVNDLSRGCLVSDVVNTIAITAIQAQAEKDTL